MATPSSVIAWKIPWTEEPGGLQSVRSQRVSTRQSTLAGMQQNGLPWWLSGKESACHAGDASLIPGLGRSPGEGNDSPLQCSCLETHGQRSLTGYSPWCHKSQIRLRDGTMAAYHRILLGSKERWSISNTQLHGLVSKSSCAVKEARQKSVHSV